MALTLKKAQRKRVKLKIGLAAPSGGGKTASSLILAYGLLKGEHPDWSDEQIWDHIAIVDTENGSGELYANCRIGRSSGTESFFSRHTHMTAAVSSAEIFREFHLKMRKKLEVLGTIAEQERITIKQRQAEGIAAARENGRKFGRPILVRPENWNSVYNAWQRGDITAKKAMELTDPKRTSSINWPQRSAKLLNFRQSQNIT